MPTVTVPGKRLVNTRVRRVSLVDRGANQTPFRILKSEEQQETEAMIDLDLSALIRKGLGQPPAPTGPQVAAVAISAEIYTQEQAADIVAKADLDASECLHDEEEKVFVFKQGTGKTDADSIAVQVAEGVTAVVSGAVEVRKFFMEMNYETTSFKELMAQEGVVPMLSTASTVMSSVIYNIMQQATSPEDAATMVGKAVDEYKKTLTSILKGVPSTAFKMAEPADAIRKAAKVEPDAAPAEEPKTEDVNKSAAGAEAGSGSEGAGAPTSDVTAQPDPDPAPAEEPVAKSDGADPAPEDDGRTRPAEPVTQAGLLELLKEAVGPLREEFTNAIAGIRTEMGEKVQAVSKAADEKVAKAEAEAAEAQRKLAGTVAGTAGADPTPVQKGQANGPQDESVVFLDSAFNASEFLRKGDERDREAAERLRRQSA